MKWVTTKWDTEDEKLQEIRDAYKKIHDLRDTVNFWKRQYDRVDLRNDNLECANAWLITWAILSVIILILLCFNTYWCQ